MTLHIFNPGHDEALAAGTPYYTHTRAALLLADSLWELPKIWAKPNDLVMAETCLKSAKIPWGDIESISPWGWNAALVHTLRKIGAPERLLPSNAAIEKIRSLSSRQTAVTLLSRLDTPCLSQWCATFAEVQDAIAKWDEIVVKAPWSSSGRGIIYISGKPTDAQIRRIAKTIERQGAVAVEPRYKNFKNFALEFRADGQGNIKYEGLSVFSTNSIGEYTGNIVCSAFLNAQEFCGISLHSTIAELSTQLTKIIGKDYCGILGVDAMLIGANGETPPHNIIINPCVEINLRRTMGWVALQLGKCLSKDQTAQFVIRHRQPLTEGETDLTPSGHTLQAVMSIAK